MQLLHSQPGGFVSTAEDVHLRQRLQYNVHHRTDLQRNCLSLGRGGSWHLTLGGLPLKLRAESCSTFDRKWPTPAVKCLLGPIHARPGFFGLNLFCSCILSWLMHVSWRPKIFHKLFNGLKKKLNNRKKLPMQWKWFRGQGRCNFNSF